MPAHNKPPTGDSDAVWYGFAENCRDIIHNLELLYRQGKAHALTVLEVVKPNMPLHKRAMCFMHVLEMERRGSLLEETLWPDTMYFGTVLVACLGLVVMGLCTDHHWVNYVGIASGLCLTGGAWALRPMGARVKCPSAVELVAHKVSRDMDLLMSLYHMATLRKWSESIVYRTWRAKGGDFIRDARHGCTYEDAIVILCALALARSEDRWGLLRTQDSYYMAKCLDLCNVVGSNEWRQYLEYVDVGQDTVDNLTRMLHLALKLAPACAKTGEILMHDKAGLLMN